MRRIGRGRVYAHNIERPFGPDDWSSRMDTQPDFDAIIHSEDFQVLLSAEKDLNDLLDSYFAHISEVIPAPREQREIWQSLFQEVSRYGVLRGWLNG